MKLFFLLVIVPFAIVAQDIAVDEPVPIGRPIGIRPPIRPGPIKPPPDTPVVPRIVPKSPFLVTVSGIVRPNTPLVVSIVRFNTSRRLSLKLTLAGSSEAGVPYTETITASVSIGNRGKMVTFSCKGLVRGSYSLTVEGEGYKQTKQLSYTNKEALIFINPVKETYAPGQTVKYRVYVVDALTNALNPNSKFTIIVKDSNDNTITTVENPTFLKGKYEGKFDLPNKAPTGTWSIQANFKNEQVTEFIQVYEYTLPPFTLEGIVPPSTPYANGKVPFEARAFYSFGGAVDGTAKLVVSTWKGAFLTKNFDIVKGVKSIDLTVAELNALPDGYNNYQYTLTVTDNNLNRQVTVEGSFAIVNYRYRITFSGNQYYTAGSKYYYSISVKSEDGSYPPRGFRIAVNSTQLNINQVLTLNSAGSASSSIRVPSKFSSYLDLIASGPEANTEYNYVYSFAESANTISLYPNYLDRQKQYAALNEWFEIKAVVSEEVNWIAYFLSSKGQLLLSQRLTFDSKTRSGSIWIQPGIGCYPRCTLTALYLKESDFIVGQTEIEVGPQLNNFIEYNFKDVVVKPGESYSFNVDSRCGSTVSLSAIDERVLQLGSNNILKIEKVRQGYWEYDWKDYILGDYFWWVDYESRFYNAKLITFTNVIPPPAPQFDFPRFEKGQARPSAPSEGPQAESPGGQEVKIRTDFSEDFCYTQVDTTRSIYKSSCEDTCRARVTCNTTQAISKYLLYGVSMNTEYGLGLTPENPSSITVKLNFFIQVDLPYSVKRNEVTVTNIAIFNTIPTAQSVTITIKKNGNFIAVDPTTYGWKETETGFEKVYAAKASENFNVEFSYKFTKEGTYFIQITAKSPLAGDGVEKPIRVEYEGIFRTTTRSVMIINNEPASTDLQCDYPIGTFDDTKKVIASVVGDLLGKPLNNLDQLIQMPGGCGEQNLITLAPTLFVGAYLRATKKLTPELEDRLKQYAAAGVVNQLSYQRSDGGFSAFGETDPSSSTWLTAFTLLILSFARTLTNVDNNVLIRACDFIIAQQQPDGSFNEPGRVIHTDMQGGTTGVSTMTAYIVGVFMELLPEQQFSKYETQVAKAITYLEGQVEITNEPYGLGILSNVLYKRDSTSPIALQAYNKFYDLRTELSTQIFWQQTNTPLNSYQVSSLNVETTAYGLIITARRNLVVIATKVANWLIEQQNSWGGFGSTQDTIMALYALIEFSGRISIQNANLDLTLTPNVGPAINVKVTPKNILEVQDNILDNQAFNLNVKPTASSTGVAVVSLSCSYYQDPASVVPSFNIASQYTRDCRWGITLQVCTSYIPAGNSNMAIITVTLPSGFRYEQWWFQPTDVISKTETFNSGTKVVFYLNSIGNKDTCIDVQAYRAQTINELKGGTIIVNDYYDTSKEGTAKYAAPTLSNSCYYPRW